jgi:hypothetical protein
MSGSKPRDASLKTSRRPLSLEKLKTWTLFFSLPSWASSSPTPPS